MEGQPTKTKLRRMNMATYTKQDVRKMLYQAADQIKEIADNYVQGRPADMGKISQIHKKSGQEDATL